MSSTQTQTATQPQSSSSNSHTDAVPTLHLRGDASTSTSGASVPTSLGGPGVNLDSYDEEQVRLMEERCILVTPEDVAYGEDSKKTCE